MKHLFQISVLSILLLSPKINFGQTAPNFGAAASFALYTITGAVGNTGTTTYITGDVGSSSVDPTGYTSGTNGNVNGKIYNHVTDSAALRTASTDLKNAYNYLNNLTLTGTATAGAQTYGSATLQQVFTPGVYEIDAAVTLTNVVYDATGSSSPKNALFIFNVHGALSTPAAGKMALAGGALAANVFWTTKGGAISTGAPSTVIGTFISDGALSYGDGSTVTGSGYSIGGAISTTNNNLVGAQQSATILPITLTSFTATANGCTANLAWATATESNSSYYEVETSTDGTNFNQTAKVASKNSATGANYTYNAALGNTTTYFLLKAVDNDGKFTYSATVSVKGTGNCAMGTTVKVSPNPTSNVVNIQGSVIGDMIMLYDMNGKKMIGTIATSTSQSIYIGMYPKGNYILRITKADGSTNNLKVVKL